MRGEPVFEASWKIKKNMKKVTLPEEKKKC